MNIEAALKLTVNSRVMCPRDRDHPPFLGRVVRVNNPPEILTTRGGAQYIWLEVAHVAGGPSQPWPSNLLDEPT